MTSHGSTTVASEVGGSPKAAEFDTIEAEIDTIKANVRHMRAEAESKHKRSELRTTRQQREPAVHAASTRIPAPVTHRLTTATTGDLSKTRAEDDTATAQDKGSKFPDTTKRSDAQTGTSKMTKSVAATISSPSETLPGSPSSFEQGQSPTSTQSDTKATYYDAVEYLQETADPGKSSPHFAQPTQAATRRVDQTLRRDTPPAKPSQEASPGRSTKAKAPKFETEKRAVHRNQKRTSLPDGWMSEQDHTSPAEKKDQISPGSNPSAASKDQAEPVLRKKTSSYMSPTKSAQHRSIATIGEDKQSRKSPRIKAGLTKVNTVLANKTMSLSTQSSPRSAHYETGSDDVFFSPKSNFSSSSPLKKERSSPTKGTTPERPTSAASERPRSAIVLPLPLPHVENTTVTRRDSEENLLDPIRKNLEREDLLRRDPVQEPTPVSVRARNNAVLGPILTRMENAGIVTTRSATRRSRRSNDELNIVNQSRTRDPGNEPVSRQTTGLRGQSSADIGKALADEQQKGSRASLTRSSTVDEPIDPETAHRHKQFGDSAIMYRGPKPLASGEMTEDPATMWDSGHVGPDAAAYLAAPKNASRPSSLRATATNFVPTLASEPMTKTKASMNDTNSSAFSWYPRGFSLFDDNMHHGSVFDTEFQPGDHHRHHHHNLFNTWHGPNVGSLHQEFEQQPAHSTVFGQVDLIHGDFSAGTPSISPTSNDTSPPLSSSQRRQRNLAQWEISSKGRGSYHWSGGDGLEISFKGMGTDAEHDPNSPVLYRDYRANTKTLHMQAASYPRTQVPGSPLPPNAPKLMRDYAEKMALSYIPCTDDQWNGRYESVSTVVPVAGLCAPCKAGDNVLHRIGGGIDLL